MGSVLRNKLCRYPRSPVRTDRGLLQGSGLSAPTTGRSDARMMQLSFDPGSRGRSSIYEVCGGGHEPHQLPPLRVAVTTTRRRLVRTDHWAITTQDDPRTRRRQDRHPRTRRSLRRTDHTTSACPHRPLADHWLSAFVSTDLRTDKGDPRRSGRPPALLAVLVDRLESSGNVGDVHTGNVLRGGEKLRPWSIMCPIAQARQEACGPRGIQRSRCK